MVAEAMGVDEVILRKCEATVREENPVGFPKKQGYGREKGCLKDTMGKTREEQQERQG